jgi:hypothetical protein
VWWRGLKASWWQLGLESLRARWRESIERERLAAEKNWGGGWFSPIFGPGFLLPQAMKSTSIYSRWKREIISTQGK